MTRQSALIPLERSLVRRAISRCEREPTVATRSAPHGPVALEPKRAVEVSRMP